MSYVVPDIRIDRAHWDHLRKNRLFVCPKIYEYDEHPSPNNAALIEGTREAFPNDKRYHASEPVVRSVLRLEPVSYISVIGVMFAFNNLYANDRQDKKVDEEDIVAGLLKIPKFDSIIKGVIDQLDIGPHDVEARLEQMIGLPYWFIASVRGGARVHYDGLRRIQDGFGDIAGVNFMDVAETGPDTYKAQFQCYPPKGRTRFRVIAAPRENHPWAPGAPQQNAPAPLDEAG